MGDRRRLVDTRRRVQRSRSRHGFPDEFRGRHCPYCDAHAGKPVRFVVPTHHHDDHSGGIGLYTAAGATIVTTPGNRKYFERMATARTTLGVNVAPATADRLRVETIANKKRVFTDRERTVEVHDIGPSPHAEEMLVAWIPEEGILFQADLISMAADGVVRPGANNDTTMHFAGWVKKQNWNVKMFSGAHASVRAPPCSKS